MTRESAAKLKVVPQDHHFLSVILTFWFSEMPRSMFATLSKGRWRETAQSGHEEGH